uniref:hypothetical protein n=1 Tax=Cyanobium sp. TaxID=2164130 RepID=UPI004048EA05
MKDSSLSLNYTSVLKPFSLISTSCHELYFIVGRTSAGDYFEFVYGYTISPHLSNSLLFGSPSANHLFFDFQAMSFSNLPPFGNVVFDLSELFPNPVLHNLSYFLNFSSDAFPHPFGNTTFHHRVFEISEELS